MSKTFDGAISAFGASANQGRPEEQLRQPVTVLLRDLAEIDGLPRMRCG